MIGLSADTLLEEVETVIELPGDCVAYVRSKHVILFAPGVRMTPELMRKIRDVKSPVFVVGK